MHALIKLAESSRRDSAVKTWVAQVQAIVKDLVRNTKEVLEDQSTNYTVVKIDNEVQVCSDRGQQLSELLAAGWSASYISQQRFEEVKKAV
jgi:hypothetical protein